MFIKASINGLLCPMNAVKISTYKTINLLPLQPGQKLVVGLNLGDFPKLLEECTNV